MRKRRVVDYTSSSSDASDHEDDTIFTNYDTSEIKSVGERSFVKVKSGGNTLAGRVIYDIDATMKLSEDGPFNHEEYKELLTAKPAGSSNYIGDISLLDDLELLTSQVDSTTAATALET